MNEAVLRNILDRVRRMETSEEKQEGGRVVEAQEIRESDTIQGVKIASTVLNDDIWLILDRSFIPHDELAVYYPEEIPLLKTKTPEDLREIHKVKLVFPGCRVIQEGPEGKG